MTESSDPGRSRRPGHAWPSRSSAGAALLLLALGGVAEAQSVKVGSFVKTSAVTTQTVPHGLGQTPAALILWSAGKPVGEAFSPGFSYAYGMTDGAASYSAATSSQDGGAPAAYRRIAAKAITLVRWDGTLIAEADRQSWTATDFVLNWTANTAATDYVVHFIAVGGPGVSAKVVNWQMRTTPGSQSATGVGFRPDVVLHAHAGDGVVAVSGAAPLGQTWAGLGLGAMDAAGGQWASTVLTNSDAGVPPTDTQRGQVSDGCLYTISNAAAVQKKASFVSMDADGFTVNFGTSTTADATRVFSLALKGVAAKAGSFLKTTTATAVPHVQTQGVHSSVPAVTSLAVTMPAASATGNLLVVSFHYLNQAATVSSVVDNKGNVYRRALGPTDFVLAYPLSFRAYTYYARNITGGGAAVQITITLGAASEGFSIYASEYRGLDTVDPLDQVSETVRTGSSGSGPLSSGSVTPSYPDELLYTHCFTTGTLPAPNPPFTARSTYLGNFSADRLVSSLGTYNVTAGASSEPNWGCHLLGFRHVGASQPVTDVGFSPDAVLFASTQAVTAPVAHARFGLGAADSSFNHGSSALADQNNVDPASVQGIDKTSRAFVKVNNNTSTIDAEAVLNRVDSNGFTLDWTTNDPVATEMLYLALGTPKPSSYARFRSLTVPPGSLAASCTASLTSYPMLVSRTGDLELRTVAHGGYVQNASGYDIVFTDAYNNRLDHEIEQYASAVGGATLVAWVRVPTLSILGSTTIFMRYGNAGVSAPTANPAGVWDTSFRGVWHLNQAFADSTANLNNGVNNGTTDVAGQMANARDFDGASNSISVANSASLQAFTNVVAAQAWIRPDTQSGRDTVMSKFRPASVGDLYVVFDGANLVLRLNPTAGGNVDWLTGYGGFVTGSWQHLAVTYDGATVRAYRNGAAVWNAPAEGVLGLASNTNPLYFGDNTGYAGERFDGRIDEARLSAAPRSACWIGTEFNNQSSPGTFYTLGTPTAVTLTAFAARGVPAGVELSWQTGSELANLGFHLHRATSEAGPYQRITTSLIPGQGSSPVGASYAYGDTGLAAGQVYHYRLEDVDAASVSTFHGPVSASPLPAEGGGGGGGGGGSAGRGGEPGGGGSEGLPGGRSEPCPSWVLAAHGESGSSSLSCTRHGDPEAVSLEVLSRTSSSAIVELRTGGFWAVPEPSPEGPGQGRSLEGSEEAGAPRVRVYVKGLDTPSDSRALALPVRRALVEAVVGRQVRLVSAQALDLQAFPGLRPSAVGVAEMGVSRDGTVRPVRRPVAAPRATGGLSPRQVARLGGTVFQGEGKSAVVELVPVRFDGGRDQLVMASRVRVGLAFAGVEPRETGRGSRGRLERRRSGVSLDALAQIHTTRRGLHGVRFEELFPGWRRGYRTSLLRLQRQGEAVAFHVEPAGGAFGPGSVLYFHADRTAESTDFTSEVSYELVRSREGEEMGVVPARPLGPALVSSSTGSSSFETNRIYQSGLLEAPDVWLWEALGSGASRTKSFALSALDLASTENGRVVVHLQGASESGTVVDHHVSASVNGTYAGEARFSGKRPYRMEVAVPVSVLREGVNEVTVVNAGDTGVSSLVFLDRFTVDYPQRWEARAGVFEGEVQEGGTAEVGGLSGPAVVLDVTFAAATPAGSPRPVAAEAPRNGGPPNDVAGTSAVKWLTGVEALPGSVRFRAEAGHRYLVVSAEGVLAPRVARPAPSLLRSAENQADYLLIAPESFLGAAEPLLVKRASQGLSVKAVSLEEIATVFGHGRPSGEAIRGFVSHAYHRWKAPSPRYVVLLGDATTDPRRFVGASWASPLPALWGKTSHLWTAMDPQVAAVNGEDALPDLAIGRIPATSVGQARSLIGKILAWEDSGQGLEGKVALVADNPDVAGDFEANVEDIRASFLSGRETTVLKVGELGAGTRAAIQEAFDSGLSLASYVGHGGSAVWASENVWNTWDAPSLLAQSRQPLLLTMNCLNGYFVAASFESLSESLLKAEGRGAIAALSPSGLSLDGPAHSYHRAAVEELVSGKHERLGDAILAAQKAYAETGLMPELLSIYHLLGDPAMRIR